LILAVCGAIVIVVMSVLLNTALGAPMPTRDAFIPNLNLLMVFVVMVVVVEIGEEAGWTAFMLPVLLKDKSFASAWVSVSAIRVLWHLPLMLTGALPWVIGLGGVIAFQFIVVWIYHRSSGVWILAAIWHAAVNTTGGQHFFRMVNGDDQFRLGVIMTALYVVAAAIIFIVERNNFGKTDLSASARDTDDIRDEAVSPEVILSDK